MIGDLTVNNEYEFRVVAVNAAGSVSMPSESTDAVLVKDDVTPARVFVDAEYRDVVSVRCGRSVTLKGYFKGNPAPKVTWEKDGTALMSNNKISINVST